MKAHHVPLRQSEEERIELRRDKKGGRATDIDFANAFNSVSHGALWAVLEGFRVPDVDWLKQLYTKLTVRLKEE